MKKCTCFFRRSLKFYFKQNLLQGYLVLSTELITYIGHYKKLKADVSSVSFLTLYGGQFTLSTQLIILNYRVILSHRRSATVFWETYPQNLWQLSILRLRYFWYRDYGLTSFRHSRVISGCSTFPFVKAFIICSFGITLLIPINFFSAFDTGERILFAGSIMAWILLRRVKNTHSWAGTKPLTTA